MHLRAYNGRLIPMQDAITILEAMTDPTRLRLLRLLRGQELCVCELVDALRMPQYKISRHLRSLRAVGLVETRRDGRWMHYRLGQRGLRARLVQDLLSVLCEHVDRAPLVKQDDSSLRLRLAAGRAGRCLARPAA
jgi:ArsR family transcriptional regulator, arsenate/arsenite/antimonite-responsive transcriptional repressor